MRGGVDGSGAREADPTGYQRCEWTSPPRVTHARCRGAPWEGTRGGNGPVFPGRASALLGLADGTTPVSSVPVGTRNSSSNAWVHPGQETPVMLQRGVPKKCKMPRGKRRGGRARGHSLRSYKKPSTWVTGATAAPDQLLLPPRFLQSPKKGAEELPLRYRPGTCCQSGGETRTPTGPAGRGGGPRARLPRNGRETIPHPHLSVGNPPLRSHLCCRRMAKKAGKGDAAQVSP